MKRVIGMVAATLLSVSLMAGVAAADTSDSTTDTSTSDTSNCTIYMTGSDSYNSCVSNSDQSAQVICTNDVYVLNNNSQTAGSGGVTVTNNGSAGNAVSGSATNQNGDTVTIGASCAPAAATTTTPVTGGKGGGNPTTTTATPVVTPQVVAPVGAVEAGDGGGSHASSLSIAGLVASAGTVGLGGVLLRKRLFGR
jgi:hypothetical protein